MSTHAGKKVLLIRGDVEKAPGILWNGRYAH
jgi:hypothetical protein